VTNKNTLGPARAQPTRAGQDGRRYPSDLSDAEWALIEAMLAAPSGRGRPPVHPRRVIVNAILYVNRAGCAWRYLPQDFPPWPTVYGYFASWRDDGTLQRIHDQLRQAARTAAGRNITPTAAVIDSQSVRAADTVPKATRGWDNAKKVNGRKRHIAVDTSGLLLAVVVTAASTQDRDGAKPLLWNLRRAFPGVTLTWADGGYAGKLVTWAKTGLALTLEIVRRPDDLHTFQVLPRRWVVERTFAWISTCRRCTRDYERLPASHEAMVLWAMIALMTQRLATAPRPD
jgi:transposase